MLKFVFANNEAKLCGYSRGFLLIRNVLWVASNPSLGSSWGNSETGLSITSKFQNLLFQNLWLHDHNCSICWFNLWLFSMIPGGCSHQCFPCWIAEGGDPQCLLFRNVSTTPNTGATQVLTLRLSIEPILQLFCAQRGMPSDTKATSKTEAENCLVFLTYCYEAPYRRIQWTMCGRWRKSQKSEPSKWKM